MNTSGKPKMEHERRFNPNIRNLPIEILTDLFLGNFVCSSIDQGYALDRHKTRFRCETFVDHRLHTRTRKTGTGMSRPEDEIEITRKYFLRTWNKISCKLQKKRYRLPLRCCTTTDYKDLVIEFNVFLGQLKGYFQIEVESKSLKSLKAFVPPAWFGPEVTDDDRYSSYNLARYGLPKEE